MGPLIRGFLLPALALLGFALTWGGYSALRDDQAKVLFHYQAMHDPGLYARDWHVQAYKAANPHRPWFTLLGLLDRALGLPGALFTAWATSFLLLCAAVFALSTALVPRAPPWLAVLVLVATVPVGALGSNWIWESEMKPRLPAYALALLAVALLVRARPVAAGLCVAAASVLHVGVGLLTTAALGLWSGRRALSFLAVAGTAFAALRLPYLLGARERLTVPGAEADLVALYLQMRAPHHFDPTTWPLADWVGFAACLGFGSLALPLLEPGPRRQVVSLGAVLLGFLAVAGFFSAVIPVWDLMLLQLFRLATLLRAVALVLGAGAAADLVRTGERSRGLFLLASALSPWSLAAGVLVEVAARRGRFWAPAAAACAATALLAPWVAVAQVVGLGAGRVRWTPPAWTLVALGALAWGLPLAALAAGPSSTLARGLQFAPVPRDDTEALALWCRSETPRDAVFLVPPGLSGFRLWSQRAEVVDWWTPPITAPDLLEWARRLQAVTGLEDRSLREFVALGEGAMGRYEELPPEQLAALARRYGAEYVVSRRDLTGGGLVLVHRQGALVLHRRLAPP